MGIAIQMGKPTQLVNRITISSSSKTFNPFSILFRSKFALKVQMIFYLFLFAFASTALADDGSFTSLLTGSSFMGSWDTLSKFDILGQLLSLIIVFFSITGIVGTFTTMMIDYGYLAGKGIFDQVYEYQEKDEGTGVLGMKGLFQESFKGSRGTGLNAIVGVGMSVMLNLKKYSSYNPTRRDPNLDEEDTMLSYTLKTFVPRLIVILMFTLAFNGTLAKSFATVAEAAAVGIDHAVSIDLAGYVDKWAVSGQGYEFTLGRDGTPEGKFGEKVAKKIYTMVISSSGASSSVERTAIGLAAEKWVYANVLGNSTNSADRLNKLKQIVKMDASAVLASADVSNFRLEVVINSNGDKMAGEVAQALNLPTESIFTFLEGSGIEKGDRSLYVHVFILKGKTAQTEFFVRPSERGTTQGR